MNEMMHENGGILSAKTLAVCFNTKGIPACLSSIETVAIHIIHTVVFLSRERREVAGITNNTEQELG